MESGASRLSIGWVSCGVWWWSGTGGRISTAPNLWYSGSPLVTWFDSSGCVLAYNRAEATPKRGTTGAAGLLNRHRILAFYILHRNNF